MFDAGAEKTLRRCQFPDACTEHGEEVVLAVGPRVGQGAFQMPPDAFVGIEFRRVGRKRFEMQASEAGAQLRHRAGLVNLSIVQYDDDMSAQMPQEIAKKHAHLVAADVHGVEVTVEAETATLGAERDTRDGRNPVVTVAVTVDRCLTTRTPCLAHGWNQQEARFVNEDNMGAQPFGVWTHPPVPDLFDPNCCVPAGLGNLLLASAQ